MNRLHSRFFIPFLVIFLSGCGVSTINQLISEGKTPLSSQDLVDLIPGMNLHLEAIDFDGKVQFMPDGRLSATSLQNEQDQGKWSVIPDNRLCLKFDRWYYGDNNCYQLIKDNDKYIFFTTNGARYYTATLISGDDKSMSQFPETASQSGRNSQSHDTSDTSTLSSPLSEEEKKETLIRVARNCPACNLAGVSLSGAQLVAANLAGADLSGADLSGANLRRANLAGANLANAKLIRTNLSGANLNGCDLSQSDLTGANLIRATVINANLDGAILSGAHLESTQGMAN